MTGRPDVNQSTTRPTASIRFAPFLLPAAPSLPLLLIIDYIGSSGERSVGSISARMSIVQLLADLSKGTEPSDDIRPTKGELARDICTCSKRFPEIIFRTTITGMQHYPTSGRTFPIQLAKSVRVAPFECWNQVARG